MWGYKLFAVGMLFFIVGSTLPAAAKQTLVIATTDSWHPYSYTSEQGEAMGILVNFWQEYSQRTGTPVEFKVTNWQQSLDNVLSGNADAHIGMVRSDKREEKFDFIEPLFSIDTKLYFNRTLLSEFSVKEFLLGGYDYEVGVLFGGYQQEYMQTHYPNVKLKTFTSNKLMMEEALSARLKAFVADTQVSNYFLHVGNKPGKLLPVQHLYTGVLYPAVAKGNSIYTDVSQGFSKISEDDKSRIVYRWIHHSVETVYPKYLIHAIVTFVFIFLILYIKLLKRSVAHKTDELQSMNSKLLLLSETDSLTGIYNRRHFMQKLEASPEGMNDIALMIFDIDNFKSVNDSFGHGVGDEVIKYVANQANSLMKKGQTLARIGGEEFAIVAYFNTSEEALNFAEQIISTIKNHSLMAFPTIKGITVSMGVAYYSYYRKTDELTLADDALYKAKTAGKDRVEMTVI